MNSGVITMELLRQERKQRHSASEQSSEIPTFLKNLLRKKLLSLEAIICDGMGQCLLKVIDNVERQKHALESFLSGGSY